MATNMILTNYNLGDTVNALTKLVPADKQVEAVDHGRQAGEYLSASYQKAASVAASPAVQAVYVKSGEAATTLRGKISEKLVELRTPARAPAPAVGAGGDEGNGAEC